MRRESLVFAGGVVLLSLCVAACGMKPQDNYQKMRANLVARNFDAVDQYLEKAKKKVYSEDNRLLFYMDKATVLHLGKKYKESNKLLEQAKQTAQDLWTESVGKNAAAWFTTDNSLPYQGEDFEKVLIHFVSALNYIGMKEYSGARVEARQITNKLEVFTSKYEQRDNIYKDDAFARWLSGKLAETALRQDPNAFNDAWIDYKKAITVYETDYAQRYQVAVPKFVVADALRALEALGADFQPEFNDVRSKFPAVEYASLEETKGLGEVVFIHQAGEAPYKIDEFWDVSANNDPIRVAFPRFVAKKNQIIGCRVTVAGKSAIGEVGEPLTAIAIQNLDDHMARIKAKAVARAIAKYIAAKAAQEAGKRTEGTGGALLQLGGAIFQAANYIAEEADKRSWITLPANVNVARVFADAGQQQLEVDLLGAGGRVVDRVSLPIEVKENEITFVSYRSFR
ncbi:COG3014 family protein [Myxococcota bacterium]